jgi:hypothetical protein
MFSWKTERRKKEFERMREGETKTEVIRETERDKEGKKE